MSQVSDLGTADKRAAKKRRSWKLRLFIIWPLACAVMLAIGVGAALIHYTVAFPNPMALRTKERAPIIRILARDGSLLSERGTAHDFMPLDLLPPHVVNAVIATEDRRFYQHHGLDPLGLARASFTNLRAGRYVQGGSTLTQQLAKNLFLSPERTIARKLEELLIALWLEVRLSKQDILELYLNRVYFGGGAYGIEAAAQRYFDKSARALSINEAAMIAGLLKAPSRYSPLSNPGLARTRARAVLRKMKAAGVISDRQYAINSQHSLRFAKAKTATKATGLEYALDFILERLPSVAGMERGVLVVETTIDAAMQRHAQSTVTKFLADEGGAAKAGQAAFVMLDTDGGIRALVGGRSHARSQYNRATRAKRQPGSAFKPLIYLAALEQGMTPASITYDLPININGWTPRNIGGHHRGKVTLRQGLMYSINAVAVRLYQQVGAQRVLRTAKRLGINSDLHDGPSLALGTAEVSLLELTGAYDVFANGGMSVEPHVIRRIKMSSGRILYARKAPSHRRIVSLANVAAMNDMLNATMVAGTGRMAAIADHPAAGKTGTSQDFRDAWFVGYTAHYAAGVWVGNDNSKTMNQVMGGDLPARIWQKLMSTAHAGHLPEALPGTKQIVRPPVDRPVAPTAAPELQRMPKQRIGEDFFARALGEPAAPQPPVAANRGEPPRRAPEIGDAAIAAAAPATTPLPSDVARLQRQKTWWSDSADAISKTLGMNEKSLPSLNDLMSLGGK